jgi:hypothetical protein
MSIRLGTSHFVSVATARRYYADYGMSGDQVRAKVEAGEIQIGAPTPKSWQRLEIIDNGTRYAIVED